MTDSSTGAGAIALGALQSALARGATEPIIPGFFPDPTICRVGNKFYLATSSFEYFPGAPLFHSTDLLSWTQLGHILDRRSQFRPGSGGDSAGIYGSTLRFHDGRFWFITTNLNEFERGQLIVTATDPAGTWSEPVYVPEALGIDADLAWDDDGTCYLTWNALSFVDVGRGIRQAVLDPATGRLLCEDYPVWQGSGMLAPEGLHLYRIGEYWYLLLAEGGTERGHAVTAARAPTPSGPFEPCPWNPVFTHRSSAHPVQNAGHADLLQLPGGEWAAVYLGARPRGSTPGFHVLGRETFLAGVSWLDGWPVCDEERFDPPPVDTAFVDSFAGSALNHRWVVPCGTPEEVATPLPDGGVALAADGLLCFRVRDHTWSASAVVEKSGAIVLRLDSRHWCRVDYEGDMVRAIVCIGGIRHEVGVGAVRGGRATIALRSAPPASPPVPVGHGGPDDLIMYVDTVDGQVELARIDGRYFSTEVAAGFTGRMLGVSASGARSIVRRVKYAPAPSPRAL
ncbi:glycoside hydrolase family 43 protein [Rathayibacter sp. KR2-224]|uniref:glycoside hydrolase family 43 protein n=1 Tax=Rathayibacter sp. KR2-224 TaxID=3400913 RepID=UPI003C056303